MKTAVIIPARYASKRLPGKPLIKLNGKEMLLHVWKVALTVMANNKDITSFVATDDKRIKTFCESNNIPVIITSSVCKSGTDRVIEAIESLASEKQFDFIINLQGDNPLCPTWFIESLITEYKNDKSIEVATNVVQLNWKNLDLLRINKSSTPFSGTCAVFDQNYKALYFSKNIIPAIRNEVELRAQDEYSPVFRQPGLYGYSYNALLKIKKLDISPLEYTEGLEQLRFLENGLHVKCVKVDYRNFDVLASVSGVDTQKDITRVEVILKSMELSKI